MAAMRVALDGSPYTWQDFEQWYGSEAARCWSEAGATEHGGDPARPLPPPTGAGATEHGRGAGATEHNPVTILSVQDLRGLARQQTRGEAKEGLHREARQWLNQIANGHYGTGPVVDLTTIWPRWSAWLATQPTATQSFESDVAAFTAESIENTRDPNRGGRPRVDFCVRLADGSYWRFHPGSKERNSAEPRHIPATLPDTTRGAAEHAAQQWTTISDDNVWTISRSRLVPQTDRMSKNAMWQQISALLMQDAIPRWPNTVDITDGTLISWWLWVSNLGPRTVDVIGNGIRQVLLSRRLEQEVVFAFVRVGNTEASVFLGLREIAGASLVYVRSE